MVALNEIIARINTLAAGGFEPGTVEEFVRSAAAEASRDPQVVEEIEANEIDQFRESPTVPNEVVAAVIDVPGLVERMTGGAIGNPAILAAVAGGVPASQGPQRCVGAVTLTQHCAAVTVLGARRATATPATQAGRLQSGLRHSAWAQRQMM
ncbi:hypothetical protein [Xylanimonas oleitrophica]|nr:hypothetical protein [Xylanimonas oleitrophica]